MVLIFAVCAYLRGIKPSELTGKVEMMTVGEVSEMLIEFDAKKEEIRRQLERYKSQVDELKDENIRLKELVEPEELEAFQINIEIYSKCDYIFIDGGVNTGDTLAAFAGTAYGEISEVRMQIFKRFNVSASDFCVFGFEGNSRFTGLLKKTEDKLASTFQHIEIFTETILTDRNGEARLYISPTHDGSSISWRKTTGKVRKRNFEVVQSVDLALFLEKFNPKVVFMKFDIEGAEYPVLSRLLTYGSFCKLDAAKYIAIDYHPGIRPLL